MNIKVSKIITSPHLGLGLFSGQQASTVHIFILVLFTTIPNLKGLRIMASVVGQIPACAGEDSIKLDQACLTFLTYTKFKYDLFAQSTECVGCPLWKIGSDIGNNASFVVNATYGTVLKVRNVMNNDTCVVTNYLFGQYGEYGLSFTNSSHCLVRVLAAPSNAFLPILFAFLILASMRILWTGFRKVYSLQVCRQWLIRMWIRWKNSLTRLDSDEVDNSQLVQDEDQDHQPAATINMPPVNSSRSSDSTTSNLDTRAKQKKRRVKSLDAFRGLAIVIMIFVNYGGGGYYFFAHSRWNGLTVADLVFPWFMWIMGVSLVISTQSQLRNSVPRSKMVLNILKRSLILILLGLVVNSLGGHNDLTNMRFPGVLQRFGIAYLFVALLQTILASRDLGPVISGDNVVGWEESIKDVTACFYQWFVMLSLVSLHICLTFLMPVPGCPTGYLGPGGLHDNGTYFNCTGGSARYIDILVFGRQHIYQNPTCKNIYGCTEPYDPEGLLGCITSIFIVFLGVQCGYTLLTFSGWQDRCKRWLAWSLMLGIVAGALCGFSKEDGAIPINKNLWSLSFVIAMAATAYLLLTLMYWLIDVSHLWSGSPLFYAGMNAILLYVGHEVCEEFFPFSWVPFTQSHAELLAMNLWGTSLWIIVAYVLYRKQIFLAI